MNNQVNTQLLTILISVCLSVGAVYSLDTYFAAEAPPTPPETPTPLSLTDTIPDVVEKAAPAVVSVVITADVPVLEQYYENYNPFGGFFGNFGFQVPQQRQVGTEEREIGGGTGFFVSDDGYIVTNKHVVESDSNKYSVVTNDGDTYDANVIARDPSLDIAILKIETEEPVPYLTFADTTDVRLGSAVIAIGNALAEFPNTVSTGVVSGLSRDIMARSGNSVESLEGVIQTDAAINQGNSGGPLLNLNGEVIGVNVAMAGNSENIGFALPASIVEHVYDSVAEYGEIVRPYLGVRYTELTDDIIKENHLDVEYGVLILRGDKRTDLAVIPGSPADKAGLEENDIILEIDGVKLDGKKSLGSVIREHNVGDTVTLKIMHDGEEKTVEVTLEKADTE